MKKKLALILTLILSIASLLSFGVFGASADEVGWSVKANDVSVTKGGTVTVTYTLKYGDDVVTELFKTTNDGQMYAISPIVKIYDGIDVFAKANGNVIDATEMDAGQKELTLKVFNANDEVLGESKFKLNVTKKDNTMTIVMIVMIVLIVAYFIWSSYSNRKRQQNALNQASELKIGDRVKTIGGVCGFVSAINDDENTFTLEVGEKSYVKFDKFAIHKTAPAQGNAVPAPEAKKELVEEVKTTEETPEQVSNEEKSSKKTSKAKKIEDK